MYPKLYISSDIQCDDFDLSVFNIQDNRDSADIILDVREDGLFSLAHNDTLFTLDLTSGNYRHRLANKGKEPLLNAIKIKKKLPKKVIDATAGVLKDAWLMAGNGIEVQTIERNPLIALLQSNAIKTARTAADISNILANIVWCAADANEIITSRYLEKEKIESIYLDPMYPSSPNSAAVKKDLALLQFIVGADNDSSILLKNAITAARKAAHPVRVVVKRPPYAPSLADIEPTYQSQTGKTRYDVYLCD